ncbi:TPA: phosphoglycerate mutase family protein, partial [Streptococcus pyogenes]
MNKNSIELWLVRHGETIFNKKNLVQGWSDSPLTNDGILSTLCLA